jgi:Putative DNA-binding domain
MQTRPLADLVNLLKEERRAWVRLAASRPQEDWQLSLLEVTLGEPPPGWKRRRWIYERGLFVASAPAGATVARWFERRRIRLNPVSLQVVPQDLAQAERRPSRFDGTLQPLPWPSVDWTVHVRDQEPQMLHSQLVASDAPAFLSFDLAGAAFFGVPPSPGRTRSFSGRECFVRQQDLRARIDSVRVRSTEVVVSVSGEQLTGAFLELGGFPGQRRRLRRGTREVHFPLADGIPSGSWIALHRDDELVDHRGLDPAWSGQADIVIEVDPTTEVELLISRGESSTTEFKRELPDSRESIINAMKTIAAFANGDGGTLLFGVDNEGVVVGLTAIDRRQALDRVAQLIADWVRPAVDFASELAEVDGKPVLIVRVGRGDEAPYGVSTTERRIDYYVRRSGTTSPATPADVRRFVASRIATGQTPAFWRR